MQSTAERVESGIRFLTSEKAQERGFDLNRVNLGILDLNSPSNCVLAQSGQGDYFDLLDRIRDEFDNLDRPDDTPAWRSNLDIWVKNNGFVTELDESTETLKEEWIRQISTIRGEEYVAPEEDEEDEEDYSDSWA